MGPCGTHVGPYGPIWIPVIQAKAQVSMLGQSAEPKSHVAIVLEAGGDIADRTRVSLYGEASERAVRLHTCA